ncbi:hypothetical protein CAC42_1879 [Sphaceloma murrayae]|uniref:Uncharacterized protein n=1 Tax=Sphaceloma murrayae TaxID=2082308 RepID=A0A2K1QW70_9PEZI|nr:hypothetical protein CAC42_1879 [Sphaceloma murrayae]
MADDGDDYDDDFYYDDDGYLYVEDSFAAADELAETSVPSPPAYDPVDDTYNFDPYEYFLDLEYGDDEYYDGRPPGNLKQRDAEKTETGKKRKLDAATPSPNASKKVKVGKSGTGQKPGYPVYGGSNIAYMTFTQAHDLGSMQYSKRKKAAPYALLPAWRNDYPETKNEQSRVTQTEPGGDQPKAETEAMDEDWEDEGEEEDDAPQIDPGVLLSILQAKLQESGTGNDAGKLQDMLSKMLADSNGNMEELLESLTASVLDEVDEEGAESGMGRWLAQQGVKVDLDEDGEGEHAGEGDEEADGNHPDEGRKEVAPRDDRLMVNGGVRNASVPAATEEAKAPVVAAAAAAAADANNSRRSRKSKPASKPPEPPPEGSNKPNGTDGQGEKSTRAGKRKADSALAGRAQKQQRSYAAPTRSSRRRADETRHSK